MSVPIQEKKKKKKLKKIEIPQEETVDQHNEVLTASLDGETSMFVLYEDAIGYALFRIKQYEEIGMALLTDQLRDNLLDYTKFINTVHLIAFSPFKSAKNALENINYISEGLIHEDLYTFLDTYLPKQALAGEIAKHKKKVMLGVSEQKLGATIVENEALRANCVYSGLIPEILRGIRQHFTKYFRRMDSITECNDISKVTTLAIDADKEDKAQLGLAHSYSRAKIKFNVNRVDNMIVQCIAILDQLDKDINKFSMRLREWYSYHFPELYKLLPDNLTYAKVVKCIGNRKELFKKAHAGDDETKSEFTTNFKAHTELLHEQLLDLLNNNETLVVNILQIAKSSMGMDISPMDLNMITKFTDRIMALGEFRQNLSLYLTSKMKSVAPNLAELLGDTVSARLISHAGSLSNLAKCPGSTIQILGAEKALFRSLKSRSGKTPKYGLLYHSPFIGKANASNKGKVSRFLANKCAIASRIDCFSDVACPVYGKFLKAQVENRIKYLENDGEPLRNSDVMAEAIEKAREFAQKTEIKQIPTPVIEIEAKKKKKKKAIKSEPESAVLNGSSSDTKDFLLNGDIPNNFNLSIKAEDGASGGAEGAESIETASSGKKKKGKKRKQLENGDLVSAEMNNNDHQLDQTLIQMNGHGDEKVMFSSSNSVKTEYTCTDTSSLEVKKVKKKKKMVAV